jgi:hypothetical protein
MFLPAQLRGLFEEAFLEAQQVTPAPAGQARGTSTEFLTDVTMGLEPLPRRHVAAA